MSARAFSFILVAILVIGMTRALIRVARGPGGPARMGMLAMRLLATTVLAVMLLQPRCHRVANVPEKPVVAVLIDDSQSMNDGAKDANRAAAARRWLDSPAFRKAGERCDLRFFAFDVRLRDTAPDQLSFSGSESNLAGAMREWSSRWRDEASAGLVVLSDGLETSGTSLAPPGVPVSVLEVESPGTIEKERVRILQVEPPGHAQAGAECAVRVVLQAHGTGGREVPVEWWSEDRKIGERKVRFPADGEVVEALLPIPPLAPGTYPFEVRVPDPAAIPSARKQPFALVVRQEGRSVLLLQNSLGFEGKFLRRALGSDRNLRLESFTRFKDGGWAKLAESGEGDRTPGLDFSSSSLGNRAAVILADVEPSALALSQWQALADYVARGGGLVVLGGKGFLGGATAASPLAAVLPLHLPAPARDGNFPVRLTEAGSRHPVFGPMFATAGGFPALDSGNLASGVAPNALVLMEMVVDGQARPLVVVKQHGDGRVAAVLTDTLWRWRVAATGWTGRQSPYDTFWTQLVEWLSPDAAGHQARGRLELTTGKSFYRQGDMVEIRAVWLSREDPPFASVPCVLAGPDGRSEPMTLQPSVWESSDGRTAKGFRATWKARQTGLHAVAGTVGTPAGEVKAGVRFAVADALGERRGEAADASSLRQLAEASGGRYYRFDESADWLRALPEAKRVVERATTIEVWNHPLIAAILFCALCAEWWLRRRARLP